MGPSVMRMKLASLSIFWSEFLELSQKFCAYMVAARLLSDSKECKEFKILFTGCPNSNLFSAPHTKETSGFAIRLAEKIIQQLTLTGRMSLSITSIGCKKPKAHFMLFWDTHKDLQ